MLPAKLGTRDQVEENGRKLDKEKTKRGGAKLMDYEMNVPALKIFSHVCWTAVSFDAKFGTSLI